MEKIEAFNFIRAFCALGIVLNHYTIISKSSVFFFDKFANGWGSWGYSLVTVFFIISGALIYLNNTNVNSVRLFYVKRMKTIYPAFYISYICVFFARMCLGEGQFTSGKNIYLIILTLLGVDGYFQSYQRNYYILGEWFLGILLILYFIYPVLSDLIKKYENASLLFASFLFLYFLDYNMLNQSPFRNVFSCLITFIMGIIIAKYKLFRDKYIILVSVLITFWMYFLPVKMNPNLGIHITGLCWFFSLFQAGEFVMKNSYLQKVINYLSNISYEIFLLQSVIINAVVKYYKPKGINELFALLYIIILSIVCAQFIHFFAMLIRKKIVAN